ncbi:Protein fam72a [Phlyctochytrium planicorne]|nr:Protein fam72a [Phlyctochytrium planicorne]
MPNYRPQDGITASQAPLASTTVHPFSSSSLTTDQAAFLRWLGYGYQTGASVPAPPQANTSEAMMALGESAMQQHQQMIMMSTSAAASAGQAVAMEGTTPSTWTTSTTALTPQQHQQQQQQHQQQQQQQHVHHHHHHRHIHQHQHLIARQSPSSSTSSSSSSSSQITAVPMSAISRPFPSSALMQSARTNPVIPTTSNTTVTYQSRASSRRTAVPTAPLRTRSTPIASTNPVTTPPFRSKPVHNLSCLHCATPICSRAMKAILLSNTRLELYSTDMAPAEVEMVDCEKVTGSCRCKIRDVACLKCGNVIGYHVTQPCEPCLDSCNNGHFWMFLSDGVFSKERVSSRDSTKKLLWAQLPLLDNEMDTEMVEMVCR